MRPPPFQVRSFLPASLGGLLLGLSMPGFGAWPLAWVALIPAMRQAVRDHPGRTFLSGALIGFIWHGLCFLWFFDLHPLTWLGFSEWGSRWVTFAGWLLLAMEGALLTGALLWIYRLLPSVWPRILFFPLIWILGFSALNWTPMALPWALLEYSQTDIDLMRRLASFLTASAPAVLLIFHNAFWAEQEFPATGKRKQLLYGLRPFIMPLCLMALQFVPSADRYEQWPFPVAVVQGNLPIELIRSGRLPSSLTEAAYIQPTRKLWLPEGALLAYPEEGVVTGWVPVEDPGRNPMVRRLIEMARERRISIAVGVSAVDARRHHYNALLLISTGDGACRFYYKRRLVPFGEFTPYGLEASLSRLLAGIGVDYGTLYEPGPESGSAQAAGLPFGKWRLGPLICFELIDDAPLQGGFALAYRRQGVDLLINANNLGWFHGNPLLEAQFLSIGRMRAAESGLPLVIAGNTGVSAIISPQGEVLKRTPPLPSGVRTTQILVYTRSGI